MGNLYLSYKLKNTITVTLILPYQTLDIRDTSSPLVAVDTLLLGGFLANRNLAICLTHMTESNQNTVYKSQLPPSSFSLSSSSY